MNKEWSLTQAALDELLTWLDPDREKAGEKYETIRTRLIKVFACRGCAEAEDLADETINRVASKLSKVADDYHGDPALFFYGVAKMIRHEYVRKSSRHVAPPTAALPDDLEDEYECLEKCMRALLPKQRNLVLQYYREDKRAKIDNRKRLAQQLDITMNALSIRAHRIKLALQQCVEACLGQRTSA